MKVKQSIVYLYGALAVAAFGQTPPARLEFEVASIKPSPPFTDHLTAGIRIDGAQVHCTYLALKDYIRIANNVKDYQVTGPDWITSERFDINAKLSAAATREQFIEMLKNLLTDRFQIKLHHESKEFPVYALVVAKGGLKVEDSPLDPEPDGEKGKPIVNVSANGGPGGTAIDFGRGSHFAFGGNKLEAQKLSMPNLADMLARFVDRPVVDMTGLKGNYTFTLQFTPEDYTAMLIRSAIAAGVALPPQALKLMESASGDSLFASLQTVGLKLDARKAPLDVLVIDQVNKTPTEN